jgi:hypothetical protein
LFTFYTLLYTSESSYAKPDNEKTINFKNKSVSLSFHSFDPFSFMQSNTFFTKRIGSSTRLYRTHFKPNSCLEKFSDSREIKPLDAATEKWDKRNLETNFTQFLPLSMEGAKSPKKETRKQKFNMHKYYEVHI